MPDYVTVQGLRIKTVEEINNDLATKQKATIASTLNTAADSPIGQLNGVVTSALREVWELAQVAYNGFNPDAAEGMLLEKVSALTGTRKRAATKSTVLLTINIDAGTTLQNGVHFANVVGDPENRWTPAKDFTAPSTGNFGAVFEAENAGAVTANSGTITDINTTVSGWNSVTNALDAAVGREADTDPILRQRREDELRATGAATLDAVRADVLQDEEVLQVHVFENTDDMTDPATGLPPHFIECVVFDGTPPALSNNEIAQLIWNTKGGGVGTFGLESGVATDSLGNFHTVYFSRPSEIEIWIEIFVRVDISTGYAGATALKEALVALNETHLLLGRDVIAQKLAQVAMGFEGIFDVTSVQLGFTAFPVGTSNLSIGPREIARLDTSRIVVTETITTVP